jgi:hypothetical protein
MRLCEKCGNELSFLGQYIHPILGKKYLICYPCYMKLDKIIEQWRTFISTHVDIIELLNFDSKKFKNNFESIVTSIMRTYGYVINGEHSIDYQKNKSEHTVLTDNKQDLSSENIISLMYCF